MTRAEAVPGAVVVETDTLEGSRRVWFVSDVSHAGPDGRFDVVNLYHPTMGATARWLSFLRLATESERREAGVE